MKIAYIVDCEVSLKSPNSVIKKVLLQTTYWVEEGHEVFVYSLHSGTKLCIRTKQTEALNNGYQPKNNALLKLYKIWNTSYLIHKNITSNNFDILYSRYLLFTSFFSSLFRQHLTIMEINSNDDIEYKKESCFTRSYNALLKRKMLNPVDKFVCVTNELAVYISKYSAVETEVIANGIKFPNEQLEPLNLNKRPVLSFVASPGNACHGYDILLKIANVLTDFDFNIVGYSGENKGNIKYYGYLDKSDLHKVLTNSDIGISALAIERHGMLEACPLKSREYYAYGMPVIGNYIDTDMENDNLYCKVNTATLDELLSSINSFVAYWMSVSERKRIVMNRAFIKIDYAKKEKNRLAFMTLLLQAHKE